MVVEQIMVGHMQVFAYLVYCPDEKEALVIDPGGNEDQLAQKVKDNGLTLKYIVNTHGHADHTGGNDKLKQLTGAQIVMHADDNALCGLEQAKQMARQLGFTPTPPADIAVKDGDELHVGTVTLQVIHTPGHSPGGICLLAEGNLFTGDTLFVGGIGRTDLPASSHPQFMNSIKQKLLTLPEETVVWPGHDYGPAPSSTIGKEKSFNPWLRPPYM